MTTHYNKLRVSLEDRTATAGIVGLGYVGLPLGVTIAKKAFQVIGFDTDPEKVSLLNKGASYIGAIESRDLAPLVQSGRFVASADFRKLAECDVIVICVPTPLTRQRQPDLSFVENSAIEIAKHLRQGQLVILESTTYPGTTREILKPILESQGLECGRDFFIGFSPEREDPGNQAFETATIPKVVAGLGALAKELITLFYGAAIETVVPVSTPDTAEAVKVTENVFRAVNIALVNELKVIFDAMDIDIWEVIEAAKTKPFGFMPFYPGPGLGGHCIPIDPFYLTWKAREFEVPTRFIELAGEINVSMPRYVIDTLARALDDVSRKSLGGARVLIIGLAYKKNVPDIRESPSFKLMELLEKRGASFDYHDPHVPEIPPTREHSHFTGLKSVALEPSNVAQYDAVLISTDHDEVDYATLGAHAKLIVDTRNVLVRKAVSSRHVVKA